MTNQTASLIYIRRHVKTKNGVDVLAKLNGIFSKNPYFRNNRIFGQLAYVKISERRLLNRKYIVLLLTIYI